MAEKPKTVRASDTEAQEEAAEKAHAELPPAGHERREVLKRRDDALQRAIEANAAKIIMGKLDANMLELDNDISSRISYMNVTNADPNYKYAWISKNNYGTHIRRLELLGWRKVQGDDPECLELKGSEGSRAGTGTPDTTRQNGDVILMKIPLDRYIAIQAREHARTIQLHQSSASELLSLADRYRKFVKLRTVEGAENMGENFEGPPIQPRQFSANPYARRAALEKLDQHLRAGNVPGMEMRDT